PFQTLVYTNSDKHKKLRAVVFRDSFTKYLIPYFSYHFKEIIYVSTKYNEKVVEKFKPDIVIDGHVERHFQL
ncbi:hypothetical protein, partial [Xanthovirga aplysinae]|uniref:hypothetical protein n=1 Tax=Xanthovirga aplysinae TaxID=2529853 RepID=UPI001CA43CAE